jgi:hypothetical protein
VWDVATGTLLGSDDSADGGHGTMVFVGERIIAGQDSNVVVYRGLGRSRHVFQPPPGATIEQASPDGSRAVVAGSDGAVSIWDVEHGIALHHEPLQRPVAESANRLVARTNGGIAIVDLRTGATLARLPIENQSELELGEDGRYLLVRRSGAPSEVWDVARASVIAHWDSEDRPFGLATGRDRLAVAKPQNQRQDGAVEIWTLDPLRMVRRIANDSARIPDGGFDGKGTRLMFATNPGNVFAIRIVDLSTGRELRVPTGLFAAGVDSERGTLAVGKPGSLQLIRLSDGSTMWELPWGLVLGELGVARGGELVAGAEGLKSTVELVQRNGNVLVALPFRNEQTYTEDSFNIGPRRVRFSPDSSRLISMGKRDLVVVELPMEQRPPDQIAAIVRARAPLLRIERGQLVPHRPPTATVRGRVTKDGVPVIAATVMVAVTAEGVGLVATKTDENGDYELAEIQVGKMLLGAQSLRAGAFTHYHKVTLHAGDNRIDLDLELAGSIAGHVVDPRGQPVAGVHVHGECAGCSEADSGDDTTGPDGSFELRALSGGGAYTLQAFTAGTEHPLPSAPDQQPIAVRDGKQHVTGARFVIQHGP